LSTLKPLFGEIGTFKPLALLEPGPGGWPDERVLTESLD
jgi:hypothetical protein